MTDCLKTTPAGVVLAVRVQPGARRTAIAGLWNGTHLKIALAAPAVDGKANDMLAAFLSDICAVRKSAITLLSGRTSRAKRIQIATPDPARAAENLIGAITACKADSNNV